MFLRLLFVLLIALNIAVGAWLLLGQDDVHGRAATDAGVPELHLLSERPPAPSSAPPPATPASTLAAATPSAPASSAPPVAPPPAPATPAPPPRPNTYTCMALGPFATQTDMRNARAALSSQAARMRQRQEQTTQTTGWWVYLPGGGSRDKALELGRRLAAASVGEYFIVSSGDQSNTVSLGLFKDPANARRRREQVVAAGFPAQMSERSESVAEYWLDVVIADNGHADWRNRVRGVGSHSTGCF
ncbi:SPOR domain-containing protein [Dyella kyungheensis]|uniref:SPOR domain-containing protein n=1 Tax=Dyella kyungheensis TaxID=1242174 RepID=A0ABS2JRK4_9GAMM|nr:SPOR domain-containing protein [Dyella kyungheensis]MBM7121593.1 SPOR domain-containing protein [Dyella kyungheensis]